MDGSKSSIAVYLISYALMVFEDVVIDAGVAHSS